MTKALVLLSGGLDSMLAARILMEQGIEVTGLSFKSYFFGTAKGKKVAGQLGIEHIEIDFSEEHLAMVKNPKYGYGKNMNPCIDCHAMMLKKAAEIMKNPLNPPLQGGQAPNPLYQGGVNNPPCPPCQGGNNPPNPLYQGGSYDFVATGEVLGERPMSQNAEALKIVEKASGLEGKLIRPLSAKLLDESDLEKGGKINRSRLFDISGRSRKRQLELVKKFGIKEFASPGGGCLLTDPAFSEKLLKLFEYWPDSNGNDIELLKWGRVFWLTTTTSPQPSPYQGEGVKNVLLIIGRDEKDNESLEKLASAGDIVARLADENGPTGLIRGIMNQESRIMEMQIPQELKMSELKLGEKKTDEEIINLGLILTGYYATKARGKKVKMKIDVREIARPNDARPNDSVGQAVGQASSPAGSSQ